MVEVMRDLFLDASCVPENAAKGHTEKFPHWLPVSPGTSNLLIELINNKLLIQLFKGPYGMEG